MRSVLGIALVGFLLIPLAARSAERDDALARLIVAKADEIRFPKLGFQADVIITTRSPGRTPEVRQYQILSKGNENSLVLTVAPAVDKGQILLMKNRDLWIFLPNVSQPVRMPLAQRLTGQVSNGDLARSNFVGDYLPRLLGTVNINGRAYYQLELNAVDRSVTYHRVLYWVDRSDYHPYKAEFYALSGRQLKTCSYTNYKNLAGMLRPSTLVMHDAAASGEESVLEYGNMQVRDLPDKIFTKDYLNKLISG
jgi:outer membrane lipoprotein-sorting protein